MGYGRCGVLHFGDNNLCVKRLTCRAVSASAELLNLVGCAVLSGLEHL